MNHDIRRRSGRHQKQSEPAPTRHASVNGEPPEPFAPNTKLSCLMLLANPSEFGRWTRPDDGAEVVFYDLFGLYTQERDLELRDGLGELLHRFQSRFIRASEEDKGDLRTRTMPRLKRSSPRRSKNVRCGFVVIA